MTDRAALVRAIQGAQDGRGLAAAVAALDGHDRALRETHAQDRELELAGMAVTAALTPVPLHEHHTAATDWLADYEPPGDYRVPMIAEASAWMQGLPPAVLHDTEEFTAQALGRAGSLAGRYGEQARAARDEFLTCVAYLSAALQKGAASGLPQIQQLIDPNNAPSATPLPTQMFDNFAPEQNDYNGGVESPSHASQISSESAPFLQQVQQQDGSGSGFGSGPAKPDEHREDFDTSNGYAEVPLGAPGQIPTSPAPADQSGGMSTPSPVAGSDQVADDDRLNRQMGQPGSQRTGSWTPADGQGYQWWMGDGTEMPFHVACTGEHWPEQRCGAGLEHAASVAIGYALSFDDVARTVALEDVGRDEGLRAVRAARGPADLVAHHNRLVTAFTGGDRDDDDAAVLHGFLAVVRPVLARDFSQQQREKAKAQGDTLPGTTKLPIKNKQDLANAEKLKGKVKGASPEKIDAYLDREKAELGAGKKKDKGKKAA